MGDLKNFSRIIRFEVSAVSEKEFLKVLKVCVLDPFNNDVQKYGLNGSFKVLEPNGYSKNVVLKKCCRVCFHWVIFEADGSCPNCNKNKVESDENLLQKEDSKLEVKF